jgi:hypothetical protein
MQKPIRLDPAVWSVLERIASDDDVSVGQIIRDAVNRDIRRRAEAKTPVRADERLVAPLRALLADDFAYARTWAELQARLGAKGYRLAEAGGGLILQARDSGDRICKASELGYSYSALLRRFDCVFPGHAHSAPLRRVRGH